MQWSILPKFFKFYWLKNQKFTSVQRLRTIRKWEQKVELTLVELHLVAIFLSFYSNSIYFPIILYRKFFVTSYTLINIRGCPGTPSTNRRKVLNFDQNLTISFDLNVINQNPLLVIILIKSSLTLPNLKNYISKYF